MFTRVSLVWKRDDLSAERFAELWLGEHAAIASTLPGLREYVVDFVEEPRPGLPDGIATLRFDSREACESAFAVPEIVEPLMRTRDDFAARAEVFFVDEHVVYRNGSTK
jgi:uncharacterized protein (TIGR02118 family)